MTDAYDELRKDWCEQGDMPRATCWHCGARPGGPALPPLDRPWSFDGQRVKNVKRRSGRDIFPTTATPEHEPRPLKFADSHGDSCACGRPTRNNAYGCDDCADELTRTLTDTPWLAEQLDTSITRQRAMQPGAHGADAIVWNEAAARVQRDLRRHLARTVKLCIDQHVTHSSPHPGPPARTPGSLSQWLLWRVDGLTLNTNFDSTLRQALKIEARTLAVIDTAPDLLYLGLCGALNDEHEMCTGAVYAVAGEALGKCRACRARYATEARRTDLQQQLDDRLCTAAEIAHLATYLGIPAERRLVRKRVNDWHRRGRIAPAPGGGEPRFRYGDVVPLLAATYDAKGA